jgi:lysophospholipase L1-like esterase
MVGINDLISKSGETVAKSLKELVWAIRKLSPDSKIYVQSILPINNSIKRTGRNNKDIEYVNSELSAFCKNKANIEYINLHDIFADEKGNLKAEYTLDGGHLNGAGYLKWKEIVAPYCN